MARAVGIDGVTAVASVEPDNATVSVTVANALVAFGTPSGGRALRVSFRCPEPCGWLKSVTVNGKRHAVVSVAALASPGIATVV